MPQRPLSETNVPTLQGDKLRLREAKADLVVDAKLEHGLLSVAPGPLCLLLDNLAFSTYSLLCGNLGKKKPMKPSKGDEIKTMNYP